MKMIKQIIKNICDTVGIDAKRRGAIHKFLHGDKKIIYNVNKKQHNKRCLFIYITFPFTQKNIPLYHQNVWQAREWVKIFDEFGYTVDVADYQRDDIEPKYDYDLVIGLIPRGIDIYSKHMKPGCKVIAYLTSCDGIYTKNQELMRIRGIEDRRGVFLKPRYGNMVIEKRIENFDAAFFMGNEYNVKSYSNFSMPGICYIKNTGHNFDVKKMDYESKSSKKFVYFGSAGNVHKGLDLLLEVFAELGSPYELFVCGDFKNEEDFCQVYEKELYHTDNIHPIGRIEIDSDEFWQLMNQCGYSFFASSTEGMAGSVLTTMSAGVINICSKECGFDEADVILLPDCSKETIAKYVVEYGNKDVEWIEDNCNKAIVTVKEKFSEECFAESVRNGLKGVLNK